MPRFSTSRDTVLRSRTRSTTLSPNCVGRVETRRSMTRPPMDICMRPSCGNRRSAMLRPDMTLIREMIGKASSWGRSHRIERAVHTISYLEILLERLKMNIRCAAVHGLIENEVNKPDNRRRTGRLLDALLVKVFAHRDVAPGVLNRGFECGQHVVHSFALVAVEMIDGSLDVAFSREHKRNIARQNEHKFIHYLGLMRS